MDQNPVYWDLFRTNKQDISNIYLIFFKYKQNHFVFFGSGDPVNVNTTLTLINTSVDTNDIIHLPPCDFLINNDNKRYFHTWYGFAKVFFLLLIWWNHLFVTIEFTD